MNRNQKKDCTICYEITSAVVSALEARDGYTAKHSQRVSLLCGLICTAMKLNENQQFMICTAALVHDIGKIGVPDSVLFKHGKLTDSEWSMMKDHSMIGYDILDQNPRLSGIASMVLHHHERFDGKGYPTGIRGEDIPLGSRMIAVADSIDAMLNQRVYRNALTKEQCRNEIATNSGLMYDPQIVAVVLANWTKFVEENY